MSRQIISRRAFTKSALAGAALSRAARGSDTAVPLGVQTNSFHLLPPEGARQRIMQSMTAIGIEFCELTAIHLQPPEISNKMRSSDPAVRAAAAEDFRKWKLNAPMDYFTQIQGQFRNAGLSIRSCSIAIGETNEEIEKTFGIAKALGAMMFSTATTLSIARRIAPSAERQSLRVGFQGRFNRNATDANLMSTPEKLLKVTDYCDRFYMQFDIGDCTGAGFDALPFIEQHYQRLSGVHLKDKTRSGRSVPFGQGDTPVKPVLEFLKRTQAGIPAYIDCDYQSERSPEEEVKTNFNYARSVLSGSV